MRLSMRHRLPVHLFYADPKNDQLERSGGGVAWLRAEANWPPGKDAARVSEGHAQAVRVQPAAERDSGAHVFRAAGARRRPLP